MKIEVTDIYRFYVPGVMKIDENEVTDFYEFPFTPGS